MLGAAALQMVYTIYAGLQISRRAKKSGVARGMTTRAKEQNRKLQQLLEHRIHQTYADGLMQ
jgi:hypothetical protein